MERLELIEPNIKYADQIWRFRQEIINYDAENKDQFAELRFVKILEVGYGF